MLDIKLLKKDPSYFEKRLQTKDSSLSLSPVLSAYDKFCDLKQTLEEKQHAMNAAAKEIGEKKRNKEDASAQIKEMGQLKEEIATYNQQLKEQESLYLHLLSTLPNIPLEGIKESLDPSDNVCVKEHGNKPHFDFTFKNHLELSEIHNLLDFQRGAKISGSGWPVYKNIGARLEWALIQLMIDTHLENGFDFWMVPHLVKPEATYGSGQLPKFESQLFKIQDKDYHLYLLPTAEVALNGLHLDEILTEEELPKKYVTYTPCFRREAGGLGAQERGLIRVHQFNKVEMFAFSTPDNSSAIFDEMVESAERILQKLELHYRNMMLVTGDMSFPAAKTLDIEVWLPGQDRYYEVSSVSLCTDYQARRSRIRYKDSNKKNQYVHTLNGSGLATSRLMVALLENNQQADGSIIIPKALRPYLGGMEKISCS